MGIVSSSYTLDNHAQRDGRRYVTEVHTDAAGEVHEAMYLAAPGTDYAAVMADRAVQLSTQVADAEALAQIEAASLVLVQQTPAEFAARFWDAVNTAFQTDKFRFCKLLWWLEERLVAGQITDTQARNSFNTAFGRSLTAGQWTTLRTSRIQPAHDRYAATLAETAF